MIESEARAKLYNIRAARRRGQIAVLAEHAGRFRFHYPSRIGRPSLDSCDARVNRAGSRPFFGKIRKVTREKRRHQSCRVDRLSAEDESNGEADETG